ncbi:MAG: hypothetical protein HYX88_01520 [Chloroflexi bacterium]|nr:hypothetical protein [Chloroflexota bacterium]
MTVKGLSDLRTATTGHLHAKPPQKGTEYLNMYLLDREAQRMEKELANMEHRQKRMLARLAEIREAIAKLGEEAREGRLTLPQGAVQEKASGPDHQKERWRKISVDY